MGSLRTLEKSRITMPSTFKTFIFALLLTFSFLAVSKVAKASGSIMACPYLLDLPEYLRLKKDVFGNIVDLQHKVYGRWESFCTGRYTCEFADDAVISTLEVPRDYKRIRLRDFELMIKRTDTEKFNIEKNRYEFDDLEIEKCWMLSDIK